MDSQLSSFHSHCLNTLALFKSSSLSSDFNSNNQVLDQLSQSLDELRKSHDELMSSARLVQDFVEMEGKRKKIELKATNMLSELYSVFDALCSAGDELEESLFDAKRCLGGGGGDGEQIIRPVNVRNVLGYARRISFSSGPPLNWKHTDILPPPYNYWQPNEVTMKRSVLFRNNVVANEKNKNKEEGEEKNRKRDDSKTNSKKRKLEKEEEEDEREQRSFKRSAFNLSIGR